ncbi:MAG: alkaline phosphatase family protein [Candidatus Korarchaeota archaeon]|nr:alkaline phosphatase family protein [Thermoproteota archaeon]
MLKNLLKNKLLITFIALIAIAIILPMPLLFPATSNDAEAALASSEEFRNSALWLFDNTFVPVVVLAILLELFSLALRRRATIIKRTTTKKKTTLILAMIVLSTCATFAFPISTAQNQAQQTPLAKIVIIVILDGTRADVFWGTSHWITSHRDEGAWARRFICTYPTVTYPNIVSIVTGTWPQIHGCELSPRYVKERNYLILRDYRTPRAEDIFEVADNYGILTVTVMASYSIGSLIGDSNTTHLDGGDARSNMEKAIRFINEHKSEIEARGLLMCIHLIDSDEYLHDFSSDSKEYKSAIAMEANLVGMLINNITAKGWANDSVVIVTADHGGIGNAHFNRYPPLVDEVPFWVWGGPVLPGAVINGGRLIDIAPTVAFILGIRKPKESTGVVLYKLFKPDVLENLKGISSVESLVLEEYSNSLRGAYVDTVLYLCGFMVVMFLLSFTVRGAIIGMRIIRRLSRYASPTPHRKYRYKYGGVK